MTEFRVSLTFDDPDGTTTESIWQQREQFVEELSKLVENPAVSHFAKTRLQVTMDVHAKDAQAAVGSAFEAVSKVLDHLGGAGLLNGLRRQELVPA